MSEVIHNIEVEAGAKFKEVWSVIEAWVERLKAHGQFASAQVHQALDDQKAHLAAAVAVVLPEGTSLDQVATDPVPSEVAPVETPVYANESALPADPVPAVTNAPLTLGGDHEG